MKKTVGSLFAGVGGICQGFIDAGFQISWANELDHHACITYKHLMNIRYADTADYLIEGDISNITNSISNIQSLPYCDVLVAGFPCQSFSIAGKRKGSADVRGELFFRIIDIISVKKPSVILLENVKNLKSHDGGNTFKIIKEELESCGYYIKERVLNTSDLTKIPQHRERIFIIGFLNNQKCKQFNFPNKKEQTISINDFIDLSIRQEDKYYYRIRNSYLIGNKPKVPKRTEVERFAKRNEVSYSIARTQLNTEYNRKLKEYNRIKERYSSMIRDIKHKGIAYQIRRGMYVRDNKSGVFPTLTANMGSGGHNVPIIKDDFGVRKLTPYECFKLQGFGPFSIPSVNIVNKKGQVVVKPMSDNHLYKQAGNTVTIPLITTIANEIKGVLQNHL